MSRFNAVWAVLALAVLMLCGIFIPLGVAVPRNETSSWFPYISDSGLRGPERYIFTEILDVAAFAGMAMMAIKYVVTRSLTGDENVHIMRLNGVCLVLGLISTFCLTLVANFPESESDGIGQTHLIGAGLVFGLGAVFAILDSVITILKNLEAREGRCVQMRSYEWLRPVIAFCSLVVFILCVIGRQLAQPESIGLNGGMKALTPRFWRQDEPGYNMHKMGATCEWLTGILFIVYFLTFVPDFRHFDVQLCLVDRRQYFDVTVSRNEPVDESSSLVIR